MRYMAEAVVADEDIRIAQSEDCTAMGASAKAYFGSPVETLYADKGGKFALRLRPGTYVLLVDGQAGAEGAVWLQSVSFKWRANIHIVQPLCSYASP